MQNALIESKQDLEIAKSSYNTVQISSDLLSIIDTGDEQFEAIMSMQAPDIVVFENELMRERFVELSSKIKKQN